MGACSFTESYCCDDAVKAFNILVEANREEYGSDSYNGTISTCGLINRYPRLKFDKYNKTNEKKAHAFINKEFDEDKIGKRECTYVDLGVIHYEVITVKKKPVKSSSKPVFKKMFVVYYDYQGEKTKSFATKTEAEKFAMKQKMKEIGCDVYIKNEYVLIKGNNTVEEFEYTKTIKKTKPSLKPMPNRIVKEIHKYIFYGFATE